MLTDCGPLSAPVNGNVSYSNNRTTYQEVAAFTCDPGYTLIGDTDRTCSQDPVWGGASPTCEIKGTYEINFTFRYLTKNML